MCFYDEGDYGWSASVTKEATRLAPRRATCRECNGVIQLGSRLHEIYQQEHDLCQICEDDESGSYIDTDDFDDEANLSQDEIEAQRFMQDTLANHECRYGETYLYRRCDACEKLLRAIAVQEEIEGCPPGNRVPPLEELRMVFTEHEAAFEYAERAVVMFSELWGHEFIVDLLS